MEYNHNPERTALDRVQRACLRLDATVGGISVRYELAREGIRLRGHDGHGQERSHIVSWRELMQAHVDPLGVAHRAVLGELKNAGS